MRTRNALIEKAKSNKHWYTLIYKEAAAFKILKKVKIIFKRCIQILEDYGTAAAQAIRK